MTLFTRQLRHELFKLFARKRSYIGFGAFLVVQLAILLLLQLPKPKREMGKLLEENGLVFEQYYAGLTLGVAMIVFTFMLLGALYVALVGGDIIAKEVEEGTMRMILCRPISRLRLLVVKMIAVMIYTFSLVFFLGLSALILATIYKGGLGKLFVFVPELQLFVAYDTTEGLWRYGRAIFFLAISTQLIAALAFMFSCFKMKPAAATILTLSVFFVDFILTNMPYFRSIQHWFISHHTRFWVNTFQEPTPWPNVAISIAYLTALGFTFWVVGALRFCTRDLKS